jgi:hypothetical protein
VITIVKKRKSFVGEIVVVVAVGKWESRVFTGFPSAVEKCFLLFHGASFSTALSPARICLLLTATLAHRVTA